MTASRTSALLLLSALTAVSLVGCAIGDALQNEKASEFPTAADVAERWEKSAPWLPDDATGILTREAPGADPAVLLATSSAPLDTEQCVEVERFSAPAYSVEGAPDPFVDTVFACGDWAVIPADGGWYGWTPNHPDEKAASEQIG